MLCSIPQQGRRTPSSGRQRCSLRGVVRASLALPGGPLDLTYPQPAKPASGAASQVHRTSSTPRRPSAPVSEEEAVPAAEAGSSPSAPVLVDSADSSKARQRVAGSAAAQPSALEGGQTRPAGARADPPPAPVVLDPWLRRFKRATAARGEIASRNISKLKRRIQAAEAAEDELTASVLQRILDKNSAMQQRLQAFDLSNPLNVAQRVRPLAC